MAVRRFVASTSSVFANILKIVMNSSTYGVEYVASGQGQREDKSRAEHETVGGAIKEMKQSLDVALNHWLEDAQDKQLTIVISLASHPADRETLSIHMPAPQFCLEREKALHGKQWAPEDLADVA